MPETKVSCAWDKGHLCLRVDNHSFSNNYLKVFSVMCREHWSRNQSFYYQHWWTISTGVYYPPSNLTEVIIAKTMIIHPQAQVTFVSGTADLCLRHRWPLPIFAVMFTTFVHIYGFWFIVFLVSNHFTMNVHVECYSRNKSCTLN
jgi:hypothetical protein